MDKVSLNIEDLTNVGFYIVKYLNLIGWLADRIA